MEAIPEAIPLLQNTDGVETIIPRSKIDLYNEVCKEREEITNLNLDHTTYKKIILADVNNYIAIDNNNKAKCKGRFEFENLALHKNKSKLVVPKAIYAYFVNDILPEDYLETNKNILDYCIGSKTNSGWQQVSKSIENGKPLDIDLQKINRYYITNKGVKIVKINKNDGREIQLEAGPWLQTIFNNIELKSNWTDYNINLIYYKKLIEKEINNVLRVNSKQLSLFE